MNPSRLLAFQSLNALTSVTCVSRRGTPLLACLTFSPSTARNQEFHHFQRRFLSTAEKGGAFNPYKILGVTPESPMSDIKTAYRRLALRYHPDRPETGNAEQFRAVQEAYEALKSGNKWTPDVGLGNSGGATDSQRASTASHHASGAARRGYYAYEEPGSTTENYFENNTRMQTFARLMLVWCVVFIGVRLILFQIFPLKGQTTRAMEALGLSHKDEPYLDPTFNTNHPNGQAATTTTGSSETSSPPPHNGLNGSDKPLGFFGRIEKAIADAAREDGTLAEYEANRQARRARYGGQEPSQPEQHPPHPSQQAQAVPPQQATYSGDFDPFKARVDDQRQTQSKDEGGWMGYFAGNAKDYMGEAPKASGDTSSGSSTGVYRF